MFVFNQILRRDLDLRDDCFNEVKVVPVFVSSTVWARAQALAPEVALGHCPLA